MVYEYEKFILSLLTSLAIKKENKGYYVIADEVEDVYAKAKAFDEVKEFITRKLKEEEEKPRTLLDDYDYGLYQAYDNVDDIILEHMESD